MLSPDHELTTPPRDWPPLDLGLEDDPDHDANVEWGTFVLTLCIVVGALTLIGAGAALVFLAGMVFDLWPL